MPAAGVVVDGLGDLRKSLKQFDKEISRQLARDFKAVANEVAADARARVNSISGRTAASIRGGGGASGAWVVGGKGSLRHYGWYDFGSRNPVRGNPRRRGPWAGSGKGPDKGRLIYPAIAAKNARIMQAAGDAVDKAKRAAGLA